VLAALLKLEVINGADGLLLGRFISHCITKYFGHLDVQGARLGFYFIYWTVFFVLDYFAAST